MKKMMAAAAVFSILTGSAFAADLPNTKGPAPFLPPPPPEFSWTGIYAGINAGGSLGTFTTTDRFGSYGTGDQIDASSRGFSGGGQVGFNYQFAGSNFVIGVEADFQGSTLQGTYDSFTADGQAGGWRDASKVNWWGTGRGRIGYAFGNILPYATGGVAYGKVTTNGNCWAGSASYCDQSSGSVSGTRVGWTAGAGLEYAITHNLTVKFEYLYTDLGSLSVPNYYLDALYGGPTYSAGDEMRTRTTFSTVRAGVNWKFDWLAPAGPVVAKY